MARITVPGTPQSKDRPRVLKSGITFTPKKTKDYEQKIIDCFRDQCPDATPIPSNVPVAVSVTAFYPVPKSDTKKTREAKLKCDILPTIKPDIDNVIKVVLDALQGPDGAFADDKQVTAVLGQCFYSAEPRLEISVEPVREVV